MKYLSLDVETTGLDKACNHVIELGVVADSLEGDALDRIHDPFCFHCYVTYDFDPWATSDEVALRMHQASGVYENWHQAPRLREVSEHVRGVSLPASQVPYQLYAWLGLLGFHKRENQGRLSLNIAGKNVATFDWPFLKQSIPGWADLFQMRQRVLDPAILYLRPAEDEKLPDLHTCMVRAGCSNHQTSHDAISDAKDVCNLIRKHFNRTTHF